MRAVHPYVAAEGWNSSAEFSARPEDGFYQLLNLNADFSVNDWINEVSKSKTVIISDTLLALTISPSTILEKSESL
jgi:hypothetical protein